MSQARRDISVCGSVNFFLSPTTHPQLNRNIRAVTRNRACGLANSNAGLLSNGPETNARRILHQVFRLATAGKGDRLARWQGGVLGPGARRSGGKRVATCCRLLGGGVGRSMSGLMARLRAVLHVLGSCLALSALGCSASDEPPETSAPWRHGEHLPASPQSAGDPVRGRELLLEGEYLTCGIPLKLYQDPTFGPVIRTALGVTAESPSLEERASDDADSSVFHQCLQNPRRRRRRQFELPVLSRRGDRWTVGDWARQRGGGLHARHRLAGAQGDARLGAGRRRSVAGRDRGVQEDRCRAPRSWVR